MWYGVGREWFGLVPPSPQELCQTSGDHLKAGIMGLSSGVFGGMTSIFTQPYRGAVESGVGVRMTAFVLSLYQFNCPKH